jgi:pterin-4a-carbinolamine dehydratase
VVHPTTPGDYRPIALTSSLCKILERLIAWFILDHTKHIWLNNNQFGFLPGRSTMDAIIKVIEDWSQAKDHKKVTRAIFFDFAKAFDLVDHKILIEKLKKHLPEWLVSWIAAYLTDRKQRVKIGKTTTEWMPVVAGVIQGSVLGPILFLLFIADINEHIPVGVELLKYADDILIYCMQAVKDAEKLDRLTQQAADGILKWCETNRMRLNKNKCQELIVPATASQTPTTTPIQLDDSPIQLVTSYKYLGVQLNSDLEWRQHWEYILPKINSIPYLLRKLRQKGFREEVLVNIYRSLALSHFNYSAPILTTANQNIQKEMEAYQRRALKAIGITAERAAETYDISNITEQVKKHSNKIIAKILSDPSHIITSRLSKTTGRTGRKSTFKPNKPRTEAYKRSVLQSYLRELVTEAKRDETTAPQTAPAAIVTLVQPGKTTACTTCGKEFKRIKTHWTKTPACAPPSNLI